MNLKEFWGKIRWFQNNCVTLQTDNNENDKGYEEVFSVNGVRTFGIGDADGVRRVGREAGSDFDIDWELRK